MSKLVTVRQVAEELGVSRDYVYDHADELGALRLPGEVLRFDLDVVWERFAPAPPPLPAPTEGPPEVPTYVRSWDEASRAPVPLLPIRGKHE